MLKLDNHIEIETPIAAVSDTISFTAEHSTKVFTPAISVFYPHTADGTQI